ncbi:MAG: serine/threonine-protein kinase [Polyangia bacterium]
MERIGAVLVDTYRIDRLIAEGGMGAVYEASHLRIPKKFAVKFLKMSLLDNTVALQRFRREAEVIATLDHASIVDLVDYNLTDDGVPYTVLEYLEGEHLGDRVSRGRLPIADTLRITAAISGALSCAHDKGIVHRDLKPENVILCSQGEVKVVDFGIAKLRGAEQLTAFNSILGTITYMAPEQLTSGTIDARADQFALGAMVYEMLSGDMPFGSEGSIPEIAERVLRKQPPPIAGYPHAVYDVVLRAMSKDAAQRYDSIAEFNTAFVEACRPIAAPAPASSSDAEEPARALPTAATMIAPAPSAHKTQDEELPELPGEATSISQQPQGASTIATVTAATLEDDEQPTETTRITRGTAPVVTVTGRTGPQFITGRSSMIHRSFGRRGGMIVGAVIGFVIAVATFFIFR